MRIEQDKECRVRPITIVLDSVDDLIFMFHRMNVPGQDILKSTTSAETFDNDKDYKLSSDIFDIVDNELARLNVEPGYGKQGH